MSKRFAIIYALISAIVLYAYLPHALAASAKKTNKIKNVILIIGDGMGPQQLGLLLSYAKQAPHSVLPTRETAFDKLLSEGELSISLTYAANTLVTDSAASASQLATGQAARVEMLGMDVDGKPLETIVETAKKLGKATGLVSDTRITHATPAGFAAHQSHRRQENEIVEGLLKTNADVMLSGGLSAWLPKSVNDENSNSYQRWQGQLNKASLHSKRQDDKDLLDAAQKQGYQLAFNKQQLQAATGKLLGLFANDEMQDAIAEHRNPSATQPSLAEMSLKALDLVNKNPRGFFLMIEAGQIDWAGHHNDTGLLLHEMLRANETINSVLRWLGNRDDTLLIITADHETGGFGFSYSGVNIAPAQTLANGIEYKASFNFGNVDILDKLYLQQRSHHELFKSFDALSDNERTPQRLMQLVNENSAFHINQTQAERILLTEDNRFYDASNEQLNLKVAPKMEGNSAFFPYLRSNKENLLAQALANEQQAVWATGTHTSTPVYVFVKGNKKITSGFKKLLHHTDIGRLSIEALK